MKQKKSPLKYFHQKITQHVKCDHHFLHALVFFFIFNPLWHIVNIEAFWYFLQRAQNGCVFCLVAFSCEQTLTEFEMSWMERRVILFFPKSSDGGGGFFSIYLYWAQQ